ncbi:MAG: FAD-dependent oxidoreductase [Pirellulales bacterium]
MPADFIARPTRRLSLGLLLFVGLLASAPARAETRLVEAESFADLGGWSLDTAFTQIMGSPYLLAHGLGRPVADATTRITLQTPGNYRVWARTKDWVAPWNAPGKPGRFQVHVAGQPLPSELGTTGADWHWQPAGSVQLAAGEVTLSLHDLTGFDGRCDALLLSNEADFQPPAERDLAAQRRTLAGLPAEPTDAGYYDLVVVGGGYAGIATAVSAARQSLKVALVQDRFVLGGNGSSEVRVWAQGGTLRGKFPHLGEIVEEFADHAPDSPAAGGEFADARKEQVVRHESTLRLFLGHYALSATTDSQGRITAVEALEVRTGRHQQFRGRLFCDCTGHGVVGALAGARFHVEPRGRMGMSNMWYWQHEPQAQSWPETPWALPLDLDDFPRTVKSVSQIDGQPFMKGEWFWESGFDQDPLRDLERIRDWNLRAVFGAFSAMKHGREREQYATAALRWVAFVGGPRESRLLEGDLTLTRRDIVEQRQYADGCVPTTWDIDLHYPKEQYARKFPENPFISRAEFGAGVDRKNGYPIPYRCFYSRNVPNLFMAGRCISVNHEALGTVRVMRTCGMMGEVVGKAAYLCTLHEATPREVHDRYLADLLRLLEQPGAMRRDALAGDLYRDTTIAPVKGYFNKASDDVTGVPASASKRLAVASLPGLVVDDAQAKLTGSWTAGAGLTPYVADGYHYAGPKETSTARYELQIPQAGRYEVRLSWVGHENRSTKTLCILERAGTPPLRVRLNQRQSSSDPQAFHSVGVFDFPSGAAAVVLSTEGADGFVHADTLQLLPK